MELTGDCFLGTRRVVGEADEFYAVNPANGEALLPAYQDAGLGLVDQAVELAAAAAPAYAALAPQVRAAFLERCATEIELRVPDLVERMPQETGLPEGRVHGETARTCAQLRMFAQVVRDGGWRDARIDRGNPDRKPMPKPDLRSMLVPVGPVVVFGASNFPLAFSTAGGDTASALAAGCPVIVKAHPAHPGTAEIVASAIIAAAETTGMPEGTFSLLFTSGVDVGLALVKHPEVKAVGFTGSIRGGRALMDAAAARPQPIPVFAEMGSLNPLVVLPGAVAERGDQIATGLAGAITLGVGQFCTCPSLPFVPKGDAGDAFVSSLGKALGGVAPGVMLTGGIASGYGQGCAALSEVDGVNKRLAPSEVGKGSPVLYETDIATFASTPALHTEVFGPAALVVRWESADELAKFIGSMEGQLTGTIHGTEVELPGAGAILEALEKVAGRVICNGFPTGVEVNDSIVHGGPYPATSAAATTSVGSRAINRFARLVAWQNVPESLLPPELLDENPLGIPRLEK